MLEYGKLIHRPVQTLPLTAVTAYPVGTLIFPVKTGNEGEVVCEKWVSLHPVPGRRAWRPLGSCAESQFKPWRPAWYPLIRFITLVQSRDAKERGASPGL